MKFEILNDKGSIVMNTEFASCIPDEDELSIMVQADYKFRLDSKLVSEKKIIASLKNSEGKAL